MAAPLSLLSIHAHPDDESSKGAGTVAKYHAEGVRTVLVCATGGEEGEILNPAMDRDDVRADIAAVRRAELDAAAAIIGYDEVVMLGYRDSGMPDSEANAHPEAFANAPLDEAVGRLVGVIRRTRPQVVLTYGDEQGGYPHPDHLRVHDISQPAIERAADPAWYP
jgi:mycothiol S-conjugate amidase